MKRFTRKIEPPDPAMNMECGIEAANHGTDAVCVGVPRFGARDAAGNSICDIRKLTEYAHVYSAHVYVTVGTVLRDDGLPYTEAMIWDLWKAGMNALIFTFVCIGGWQRRAVDDMLMTRPVNYACELMRIDGSDNAYPVRGLTCSGNVMDAPAALFCQKHGVYRMAPVYEKQPIDDEAVAIACRQCMMRLIYRSHEKN